MGVFCWKILFGEPQRGASNQLRDVLDQPLGGVPADTGVGDGLAVDVLADLLGAGLQVALDHEALDHVPDVGGVAAGMEDLLADAGLLHVLLGGGEGIRTLATLSRPTRFRVTPLRPA